MNKGKPSAYWDWIVRVLPRYRITRDGRVFTTEGVELRQQTASGSRYKRVRLSVHGVREWVYVHVLVALAFHGLRPSVRHEVRHLDGTRANNHADNLAWGTWEENVADRVKLGKSSCGVKHGKAVRLGKFKAGFTRAVR